MKAYQKAKKLGKPLAQQSSSDIKLVPQPSNKFLPSQASTTAHSVKPTIQAGMKKKTTLKIEKVSG
jgi:hypothetical protein